MGTPGVTLRWVEKKRKKTGKKISKNEIVNEIIYITVHTNL